MGYQELLNVISPQKPILSTHNAILSAPVRHIFMMGTIWHLAKNQKRPLNVLEIGSWFGASALSWGQGLQLHNNSLGSITCVDQWRPWLDTKLNDQVWYQEMNQALDHEIAYNIFLHNMKFLPTGVEFRHLRGSSQQMLPSLKEQGFDVVFIDADHAYTAVKEDIERSIPLVAEGGILCGDDLNMQLGEVDAEFAKAQREVDFCKDPKSGRNFHPGVTLAVAETLGEVSSWGGFWAVQKVQGTWRKISLKDMPVHYPQYFPESALERARSHFADLVVN